MLPMHTGRFLLRKQKAQYETSTVTRSRSCIKSYCKFEIHMNLAFYLTSGFRRPKLIFLCQATRPTSRKRSMLPYVTWGFFPYQNWYSYAKAPTQKMKYAARLTYLQVSSPKPYLRESQKISVPHRKNTENFGAF